MVTWRTPSGHRGGSRPRPAAFVRIWIMVVSCLSLCCESRVFDATENSNAPGYMRQKKRDVFVLPPLKSCPGECSANGGVCDHELGTCRCPPWLKGEDCSQSSIPSCELSPAGPEYVDRFLPLRLAIFILRNEENFNLGALKTAPDAVRQMPNPHPLTCPCLEEAAAALHVPVDKRRRIFCYPFNGTLGQFVQDPTLTVLQANTTERSKHLWFNEQKDSFDTQYEDIKNHVLDNVAPHWLPLSRCHQSCRHLGWCSEISGNASCHCFPGFEQDGPVGDPTTSCQTTTRSPDYCPNMCNGQGSCIHGFCHCHAGFWGMDCALSVAPSGSRIQLFGRADSEDGDRHAGPTTAYVAPLRPTVYVYNLDAQYYSTPDYLNRYKGDEFNRNFVHWFRDRMLSSRHRTPYADEADYFFIPVSAFCQGKWVEKIGAHAHCLQEMFLHVIAEWPMWNRTGGARHIVTDSGDAGLIDRWPHWKAPIDNQTEIRATLLNMDGLTDATRFFNGENAEGWDPRLAPGGDRLITQLFPLSPDRRYIQLQSMGLHMGVKRGGFEGHFRPRQDLSIPSPPDMEMSFLQKTANIERCAWEALLGDRVTAEWAEQYSGKMSLEDMALETEDPALLAAHQEVMEKCVPNPYSGAGSCSPYDRQCGAGRYGRAHWIFFRGHVVDGDAKLGWPAETTEKWGLGNSRLRLVNALSNREGMDVNPPDGPRINEETQPRRAVFCACVDGTGGGVGDRCWKSVVAGCIPILIQPNNSWPFEEVVPWEKFSVVYPEPERPDWSDMENIVKNIPLERVKEMRREMFKHRRRFMWSSVHGSYLDEDGSDDGFATVMQILAQRLGLDLPGLARQEAAADGAMKVMPNCQTYMNSHNPFWREEGQYEQQDDLVEGTFPGHMDSQCDVLTKKWPAGGAICCKQPHGIPPC